MRVNYRMRFGNCSVCNKYKYLPSGSKCPSCTSTDGDWVVVQAPYGRIGSGKILHDSLTKQKAKKIAEKSKHRMAKKKRNVATA